MTNNRDKILDHLLEFKNVKLFNNSKTKIVVKNSKTLGTELVCRRRIKKGERIAWYKFMVFNMDTHEAYKHSMYSMSVYTKKENLSERLIGDLFNGSLQMPSPQNITYYAFFSNEPTFSDDMNCYLDIETKLNYKHRKKVKVGDTMTYSLRAERDILPGEKITWCYGPVYARKYVPNCPDQ